MLSPEIEVLDQLLGGELSLTIIVRLFPDEAAFRKGVHGLLSCGDVRMFTIDGIEVPPWRWQELFIGGCVLKEIDGLKLDITDQGARKVG